MEKEQDQPLVEPEIKTFTPEEKKEILQPREGEDSDNIGVNNDYPIQDIKHGEAEPELDPEQPTIADKVAPDVSQGAKNSGASTNDLPLVQNGETPHLYQQYEPVEPASDKELDMPLEAFGEPGKVVEEYKPKLPENADETLIDAVEPKTDETESANSKAKDIKNKSK